jgi:hypothetical protein
MKIIMADIRIRVMSPFSSGVAVCMEVKKFGHENVKWQRLHPSELYSMKRRDSETR